MEIITDVSKFKHIDRPLFIAIGNFDGIHLGHQQLVRNIQAQAEIKRGLSAVLTFTPHPLTILQPQKPLRLLMNDKEKAEYLGNMGMDYLILYPFSLEFASWSPDRFVQELLVGRLNVSGVTVGFNFTFGSKGAGTSRRLVELGKYYGFDVTIIPPVLHDDVVISSTHIRQLIMENHCREAARLFGGG